MEVNERELIYISYTRLLLLRLQSQSGAILAAVFPHVNRAQKNHVHHLTQNISG
jgi:hypothetical protein